MNSHRVELPLCNHNYSVILTHSCHPKQTPRQVRWSGEKLTKCSCWEWTVILTYVPCQWLELWIGQAHRSLWSSNFRSDWHSVFSSVLCKGESRPRRIVLGCLSHHPWISQSQLPLWKLLVSQSSSHAPRLGKRWPQGRCCDVSSKPVLLPDQSWKAPVKIRQIIHVARRSPEISNVVCCFLLVAPRLWVSSWIVSKIHSSYT